MNKRFTQEQILAFLCEADMGVPVQQLCSKHGFRESTYYQWRARIVAGRPSILSRLMELESENVQLKRFLANALLESSEARPSGREDGCAFAVDSDEPLEWPELQADLPAETLPH